MTTSLSKELKTHDSLTEFGFSEAEITQFQCFINKKIHDGERGVFKKGHTGLARTVVIFSPDEIYILQNSRTRGDKALGSGAVKTLKTALNALSGQKVATFSLSSSEELLRELSIREAFASKTGLQEAPLSRLEYASSVGLKTRVFETLYDQDLMALVKDTQDAADAISMPQKQIMARQLISGLLAMQQNGFVHRDIKPENILIKKNSPGLFDACLSDFGLSCHLDDKERQLIMQGSPKYFSPEYIQYALAPLEMPPEFEAKNLEVKAKEEEILALIDPEKKAKSFSEFLLMKYLKANPSDKAIIDGLKLELKALRDERAALKPQKDFSCVTTFKHDNYALGLTMFGLFTSKEALDKFLESRDEDISCSPLFEGYDVSPKMQVLITGLLKASPTERLSLDEAMALV
jgi:serine/threonine protein kinase